MKLGTQVWALITVVASIAVLAAGWFVGVSPLLDAQGQAESSRQDAVDQNDAIAAKIAVLQQQKNDLADYESRNAALEESIPSQVEAAAFIRTLNDLAIASNVQISSISVDDAVPYVPPSGDPADAALAPNPVTDALISGENFLLVPVTIEVTGGWNEVLAFTHGMQTGSRLVLITTVNTSADAGVFTTSLSGAMYVLIRPDAPASAAESTDDSADTASAG